MRSALMRLVLVALVPLLVVEAAVLAAWYYTRWTRQAESNLEAAWGIAAAFEDYIRDVRRQEFAVGRALAGLRPYTPAQAAAYLTANLPDGHTIRVWNWISPEGKIIASSDSRVANHSVAAQQYFRELLRGRSWEISDLLPDESSGDLAFVVARRIDDGDGRLLGVVSAVVDPQEFGTHVAELHRSGPGAVSIFDHRGVRVFGSDPRRAGHENCRGKDPLLAAVLDSRTEQTGVLRLSEDNRKYVASRVPIQAVDGWVAGARWPISEAMAGVYTGLWLAGGISLLVAVGSGLLATRTSHGLIRQLRGLQHHADAIAHGELGHTADTANIRELAELANTFNQMGVSVRDAQQKLETANAALEDRVRERTAQLGATIRRLETEVSQRVRVEQELRAASLYARGLLEANLDPLVTISPAGKITDVNEATVSATGLPREHLIGSDFSDYFTEPERAREGYRKVLADGLVHDYPLTIRHVDGRTMDVLYNAVVYRNAAGGVQGVFAAARDVTERLRIERDIRAVSRYARGLLEASLDPLVTISPAGKITDVNEATVSATGLPRQRLIGSDFSDYFTEPDRARQGYQRVLTDGLVHDYALTIRHVDGHTIDVLYNAVVYRNEAGQVQGVFATARDVTERNRTAAELEKHRRHLEELVEQRTAELRYQLQLVQSIANEAAESIIVTDREGRVTFLNPEAQRTFQFTAEDAFGQVFHDLTHHHRTDGSLYPAQDCPLHTVYTAGETVRDHEDVFFRKDGSAMAVECSSAPLEVAGHRIGGVLIARDITERKRAEETLRKAADQLARSNEELEQFAYVASHDLQEPLRVISGYVQLIDHKYKGRLDADGDQFLHYITDGATRMRQLITDLLDYSRVGTRGKALQPTDLKKVLGRVEADLKGVIDESGAAIKCRPLPTVLGDETQLARLFQNLIGNAIKFRNQRPPEIEISASRDGDHWTLAVRDNGIGIEPQYWERIFVIFQRLHTRQKYPGTGIGLAICKRIVERHGGTIWLDSQPGDGTTFYFTLSDVGDQ
ncbi:MAG: PAS domain S-box protein [Planctomycetaceae bacterium]|nr:PAS domain S-box protein [Planctomycetaceae bacterium]